jgi:CheY-like chemotaxis protein
MEKACKILIGEDDIEDQFILKEYFRENGFNEPVAFENNGKKIIEYLERIENNSALPQLIVLDLNMPILNGTQTLYQIKQDQRFNFIPVIIYSTSSNEHEKRKCLNFGAVDYLEKPLSVDQLKIMVNRFLEFIE